MNVADELALRLAMCREVSAEHAARKVIGCAPADLIRRIEEEGLFEGKARRTPGGKYRIPLGAVLKAAGVLPALNAEETP